MGPCTTALADSPLRLWEGVLSGARDCIVIIVIITIVVIIIISSSSIDIKSIYIFIIIVIEFSGSVFV